MIPFKAVAIDMDGTFLRDDKSYDKKLFSELLNKMKERDIHFSTYHYSFLLPHKDHLTKLLKTFSIYIINFFVVTKRDIRHFNKNVSIFNGF